VDEKVTFFYKIENKDYVLPNNVKQYTNSFVLDKIYKLALESGKYSKFRIDKKFPIGSFERLYKKWVENSLNQSFGNIVYIYELNNDIVGLLTFKDEKEIGTISIISVDKNLRGKGIGSDLIKTAFYYYVEKNIFTITVSTQKKMY